MKLAQYVGEEMRNPSGKHSVGLTATFLISIVFTAAITYSCFVNAAPSASTKISSSGTVNNTSPDGAMTLHVEGRNVKDANGNVVVLRGVNRGQFHDEATGAFGGWGVFDITAVEKELDAMRSWGINVLRLYTAISFWKQDADHRQRIRDVISHAAIRGIYVSYCPWTVKARTVQDSFPYPPRSPSTDVIASTADYVDYWVDVATQLKQYDNVIFELWNEPGMNIPGGATAAEKQQWFSVAQEIVDRIRQIGAQNLIVIEWASVYWDNGNNGGETTDWIYQYPIAGSGLVYSTHLYANGLGYNPYSTTYDQVLNALTKEEINIADKPMWIGEIGCSLIAGEDEFNRFRWALQILNSWSIGYAVWEWWGPGRMWSILEVMNWSTNAFEPNQAGQMLKDAIANG